MTPTHRLRRNPTACTRSNVAYEQLAAHYNPMHAARDAERYAP